MDKVTFFESIDTDGNTIEHAFIDKGNGESISMHKSTYDEMIAQQELAAE
jgi:hypothetical protein